MSNANTIAPNAIVVYHANCIDGFGSAWAFHKLAEKDYPGGVKYMPFAYGQAADALTDYPLAATTDLFILDFSFSRNIIETLALSYASITVLDHHKTAAEQLQNWHHLYSNLEIVFDMGRSGAGITWDYMSGQHNARRPPLIDYIEDRDIWIWNLPHSAEINSIIGFTQKTFPAYTAMNTALESDFESCVDRGGLLLEQNKRHCVAIISSTRREITINGIRGLCCNCNGQFASAIGNVLAKESGTFGATYFTDLNGDTKFSLRSIGDFDVSRMAQEFGGGGHKNAAGFTLLDPIDNAAGSGVTIWNIEPS